MNTIEDFDQEDIIAEPEEESWFTTISNGFSFLQSIAWYIVIFAAVSYYLWTKYLSHRYYKWLEEREKAEETARIKKDPEVYIAREEARMAAVQRLQEEYNQQAIKMQEIMKEKEEKKREERLAKLLAKEGGRKLNEDYNPLMGKSGPSYRAQRQTPCSGGSCGR